MNRPWLQSLIADTRRAVATGIPSPPSDVWTLELTEGEWWALTSRARKLLQLYGRELYPSGRGYHAGEPHRIEITSGRIPEIEVAMRGKEE